MLTCRPKHTADGPPPFLSVAVLFLLQNAEFLAGVQIFVYGGGMVALVVALFLWAGRDATPRPPDVSTPTPQAAAAEGLGFDELCSELLSLAVAREGEE